MKRELNPEWVKAYNELNEAKYAYAQNIIRLHIAKVNYNNVIKRKYLPKKLSKRY
jgi:hypothetical protein